MHHGYPPPHRYASYPHHAPRPSNGLGVAGFIVSLVGLVATCGVLCPLGLLFSLVALFRRPRGLAIAGTVIGLVGTVFVAGALLLVTVASATKVERVDHLRRSAVTEASLVQALERIELHRAEHSQIPPGIEGNKLLLELSDGWGNSIRYDLQDNATYLVRSAGPDGQFDTGDDLTSGPGGSVARGK